MGVVLVVLACVGFVIGFTYGCVVFHCPAACVLGFGCGSVMIGVTPKIGCVWDSMLLVYVVGCILCGA